jgi:hypothetical protein
MFSSTRAVLPTATVRYYLTPLKYAEVELETERWKIQSAPPQLPTYLSKRLERRYNSDNVKRSHAPRAEPAEHRLPGRPAATPAPQTVHCHTSDCLPIRKRD